MIGICESTEYSLMRPKDKVIAFTFTVSMVICLIAFGVIVLLKMLSPIEAIPLISLPFLVVGIVEYIYAKKVVLLFVYAVAGLLFFFLGEILKIDNYMAIMAFVGFILIGSVGAVAVIVALQRFFLYRVIIRVEYINVNKNLNIWDRIILFTFNIPEDVDTRKITMNYDEKRSGISFRDMFEAMLMASIVGIFLWIYITLNPALMMLNPSLLIFTMILFIPILILPWFIFKSLNVRIQTHYRDFTLYNGVKETLKKMAVPAMAAFLFIAVAYMHKPDVTVSYLILCIILNLFVIVLTAAVFYIFFEREVVDDAITKWRVFRPVSMMLTLDGEKQKKNVIPGTPQRDTSEIDELDPAFLR